MDLKADPERQDVGRTGIYVRALRDGCWKSVDIIELDAPSLLLWLRSRGGNNPYAEDVVGILLGHGHLHGTDIFMERNRANYKIVRFTDSKGLWRWRMTDRRNEEIVGASHENFSDLRDCQHNLLINTGWTEDEVES